MKLSPLGGRPSDARDGSSRTPKVDAVDGAESHSNKRVLVGADDRLTSVYKQPTTDV